MFKVGDLVKVVDKGIDMDGVEGLLVVNDVINPDYWNGSQLLELRNCEGEYYGIVGSALAAV